MAETVTAIQFEDGSCHKFNYQLDNSPEWKFINLGMGWYLDVENTKSYLNDAIRKKDIKAFTAIITRMAKMYNESLAAYFKHAIEIAKEQGNNQIINEIFNGGE